jgi:hypothetical protein
MSSIDTPQSQPADLTLVSQESIQQIKAVFPDILRWPESWMGDEHDLVAGHLILDVFMAYLAHLIDKGRARSTMKKHADFLWALGGEIIRDTSESGFDQNRPAYDLVLGYVDNLGGPYWRHASCEEDQLQYDRVCRALYRFLHNTRPDR